MRLFRPAQVARARRGGAMIAALLVVFAVATMGMIHVQLDLSKAREQRGAIDTKRAFYMAEAGLAEGFNGIASGKSGNVGTETVPARFANGVFFTTADDEGDGRVTLTSTGMCGAGRATLSIVIERTSESTASMGFFGDEQVTVQAGALIDSYDSRVGPYVPPAELSGRPAGSARVGCNGSVQVGGLLGSTIVYGDARPGPDGVLVRGLSTTITGTTAPYLTKTALPQIEVPSFPSQGSITTTTTVPHSTITPGDLAYDELHVTRLGKLTILGPARIVVKRLLVDGGGELVINAADGPVKIYVTGNVNLATGSKLSTPALDPQAVSLLVSAVQPALGLLTPAPVQLATTGSFYGTLYAPAANVTIPATMQVFGAASADQLTVAGNGKLHFDRALLTAGSSEGALPILLGWRLIELPNVPLVKLRYDALAELEASGVTVEDSKDAHFDIGELAARVREVTALLHKSDP